MTWICLLAILNDNLNHICVYACTYTYLNTSFMLILKDIATYMKEMRAVAAALKECVFVDHFMKLFTVLTTTV